MTDATRFATPPDHVFLGDNHRRNERRTWLVIIITAAMMVIEITPGSLFGSMALVADARASRRNRRVAFHQSSGCGGLQSKASWYPRPVPCHHRGAGSLSSIDVWGRSAHTANLHQICNLRCDPFVGWRIYFRRSRAVRSHHHRANSLNPPACPATPAY